MCDCNNFNPISKEILIPCLNPDEIGGNAGNNCEHFSTDPSEKYPDNKSSQERAYYSYTCTDQIFGSQALIDAEKKYKERTGENVYMGFGALSLDKQNDTKLGFCYKATIQNGDAPILFQNIESGSDVDINQIDLILAGGGCGLTNACANGKECLACVYNATPSSFGDPNAGILNKSDCKNLPPWPSQATDAQKNIPANNLQTLCELSFDRKVKNNPSIISLEQVPCPNELTDISQMKPKPDKDVSAPVTIWTGGKCQQNEKTNGNQYCLTTNQDCTSPTATLFNSDKVNHDDFQDGFKVLKACSQDSFTRINQQYSCYAPDPCLNCQCNKQQINYKQRRVQKWLEHLKNKN